MALASSTPFHWYNAFSLIGLLIAFSIARNITARRKRNPTRLPYPPGPRGYPILGALFDLPLKDPWIRFTEWKKTYGDMIYFEVLGQPFLILSSTKRTNDIFDKRAVNYSDRLKSTLVMDLMNNGYNMFTHSYGALWKKHRRVFHEHFGPAVVSRHSPVQTDEARVFLTQLLEKPEDFLGHIRRMFAATIARTTYGMTVESNDHPYIKRSHAAADCLTAAVAVVPSTLMVDLMPWLKHIPTWFPGAAFKKRAERARKIHDDFRMIPFAEVKEQLNEGRDIPCVAATLIKGLPPTDDPSYQLEHDVAEGVAATAFIGGADTTLSSIHAFFYAMMTHPEVVKKAQAELDRVVGSDRLPETDDQASLPYIKAICKELLRWHNVAALGVPHRSRDDDEYDGYFIPKGTIVIGNTWSILHDPEVFEDPFEFKPERYINAKGEFDESVLDPTTGGSFGYGRRTCPGRFLSYSASYLIVSHVLSVFDISKYPGTKDLPKKLELDGRVAILSYPAPFECRITPRNAKAEELIRTSRLEDF